MAAAPVPVRIHHLVHEQTTSSASVILRSADERQLVLHIGTCEWQAIQWGICRVPFPRPLTHDFSLLLCKATQHQPDLLHIHKSAGGTYFARIRLRNQTANKSVFIDCRPSDGLAMASRLGSIAIVVNEGLLESCV